MSVSVQQEKTWRDESVMARLSALYHELLTHDGYGELRVDVRILKRQQREVIITCGKQYRYVVDAPADGHAPVKSPDGLP